MVMEEEHGFGHVGPPKKYRAQDRYAQEILSWLWDHPDQCEENEGVLFYRGSMHQLVKKLRQSAQAGDVVNIMREHGAIRNAGHGLWEICRKEVFNDDDGNPITVDVESYGHDPQFVVLRRLIREQGERIITLEENQAKLTIVVVELAKKLQPEIVTANEAIDTLLNEKQEPA